METKINEIEVNGIVYVPKSEESEAKEKAESLDGMEYVIVRTYSAGVFAGYLKSRNGQEVVMLCARRLWSWSGAASLSQLSIDGVSNPDGCKFPEEVPSVELMQAIEILPVSEKARKSIDGVKIWKK